MSNLQLKTPVAFIIFNRPDTTEKVFEAIRQAKPPKLLVIADGSRANRLGEAEKCAATRGIIDRVDWDCEVLKNYSDTNLGCGLRLATGINWVFEQVEEAIILEDDCLPHPTFFRFCEELLGRYRDEQRIMGICGNNFLFRNKLNNFLFRNKCLDYSYYFSRYFSSWGWASWRRAWHHFDFEMKRFPEILENSWLDNLLQDKKVTQYWIKNFNLANDPTKLSTWDYQWQLACWLQDGLIVRSNTNLVSNIGFGAGATHTTDGDDWIANMPIEAISFPLKHPNLLVRDEKADNLSQKQMLEDRSTALMSRIRRKVRKITRNTFFKYAYRGDRISSKTSKSFSP